MQNSSGIQTLFSVALVVMLTMASCNSHRTDPDVCNVISAYIKNTIGDSGRITYRLSKQTPPGIPPADSAALVKSYDSIKSVLDTAPACMILPQALKLPSPDEAAEIEAARQELKKQHAAIGFINREPPVIQVLDGKCISNNIKIPVQQNTGKPGTADAPNA